MFGEFGPPPAKPLVSRPRAGSTARFDRSIRAATAPAYTEMVALIGRGRGGEMRGALVEGRASPFVGVYDAFSASLAARRFDTLFLSGFGFAASAYGLPDAGFISWSDMVTHIQRIRAIAPVAHLLVDLDDGYGDPVVAANAAMHAEDAGASGIVLEDQERPRKCGHLDGKRVMPLEGYLEKLEAVLDARTDMFVVARTDASDPTEMHRRALAFAATRADAVLVDGLKDIELVRTLAAEIDKPLCFNQIAGGRSPARTLTELGQAGVSIASTARLACSRHRLRWWTSSRGSIVRTACYEGQKLALPGSPTASSCWTRISRYAPRGA